MSKNFLDLLPEEEQKKAVDRAQKRLERRKARKGLDVSPEIFEIAEFGYYFGWDALMAIRRGYTVVPVTGEKELLSMEEMQVLLEGARKVWYSKLLESASTNMASTSSAFSKTPRQSLETQLKPIQEMAAITE